MDQICPKGTAKADPSPILETWTFLKNWWIFLKNRQKQVNLAPVGGVLWANDPFFLKMPGRNNAGPQSPSGRQFQKY